ncbi:MAG: DUF695 domain-containing protein [Epsilonproteobacteria bacterium]|nr:DUF695 domain-containing protein [Campylobacterota bacterium]
MQEYWELYMKNLEGHPATVQFNAGISMEMEELKYTYPTVAFVKAILKEPMDSGLLRESEEPEILFMEDKLEASLIKFRIGKYVGRVITDSSVTFIYYLQFTYNWQDFLDFALDEFKNYEITSGFQEDGDWNYYQNLLYPTVGEWQIIQNHKACDVLKEKGDNLHQKRAIEHKVFFKEDAQKEAFIVSIEEEGFSVQETITNDEGVGGIKFYRVDKPFYYDIDGLTQMIIAKAEEFGGAYDGWETSLVKL